jgi:hypothetical protein
VSASAQNLHQTNCNLLRILDKLSPPDASPTALSRELMDLFAEVLRVGSWLHPDSTAAADSELQKELSEYHRLLQRLKILLPDIHAKLLTERARLESERAHLRAAADWARASRKISS